MLAASLPLALGACEYGMVQPQELGGRYVLRSVDGAPLPYVIAQLGDSWTEFVDGRLDVDRDGTFQLYLGYREVAMQAEQEFSETSNGTWNRSASGLTFVDTFGRSHAASFDGTQVTLTGNYTYVFSR